MITSLPKVTKEGVYARHSAPQNRLGEYFCDNERNRLWVYLRANEALSKGAAVASRAPQTISSGLLAAAAGSRKLAFGSAVDLDTTFPSVPNQPRFTEYMLVHQVGGSQMGTVYEHRQRECSVEWFSEDDFELTTALAADDDVTFATPWLVDEASTTAGVIGFAQRAIAVGEYFWALVEGIGWGIANAAIAASVALRVADTDGELDDVAEGSVTAVDSCAHSLAAAASGALVPMVAAAPTRIGILPFQGGRSKISYQHPSAS